MTPFLAAAIAEMLPNAGAPPTCDECGFDWRTRGDECLRMVRDAPATFAHLLEGHDATQPVEPSEWSPSAYVWHVADVVRAWAERLHGLSADPSVSWAGFDPDELGRARRYMALPAVSAPWSVACSADDLQRAVESLAHDTGFTHPEWGHGTVEDALRWVAHEVVHHTLDVQRGVGAGQ